MGKWLAPDAVHHSHGLEGTKRPDFRLLICNVTGITSKSKHTVKYPDLPSTMRPVPHSEIVDCTKASGKSYSEDNTDFDKGHRQKEGDNVDRDPTFEASCFSSEPHLLTQEDIVRNLNLSENKLNS